MLSNDKRLRVRSQQQQGYRFTGTVYRLVWIKINMSKGFAMFLFLKMDLHQPLFVYFRSFHAQILQKKL